MPPSIGPTPPMAVQARPLTQEAFLPFGTVIQNTPAHRLSAVRANQGSALKIPSISPLTNNYANAPSETPATPSISMFVCAPRTLRRDPSSPADADNNNNNNNNNTDASLLFDVDILERHPYTTQTFTPLALSPAQDAQTRYLVIVCPSAQTQAQASAPQADENPAPSPSSSSSASVDPTATTTPHSWTEEFKSQTSAPAPSSASAEEAQETGGAVHDPPDLAQIQAFVARGDQAVTYGAGTWHAPMVVLGDDSVEFVVVQFVNGVALEDCEEVEVGGAGITVRVPSVGDGADARVKAKI